MSGKGNVNQLAFDFGPPASSPDASSTEREPQWPEVTRKHAEAINTIYNRKVYKFGHCPKCNRKHGPTHSILLCDECYAFLSKLGRRPHQTEEK